MQVNKIEINLKWRKERAMNKMGSQNDNGNEKGKNRNEEAQKIVRNKTTSLA